MIVGLFGNFHRIQAQVFCFNSAVTLTQETFYLLIRDPSPLQIYLLYTLKTISAVYTNLEVSGVMIDCILSYINNPDLVYVILKIFSNLEPSLNILNRERVIIHRLGSTGKYSVKDLYNSTILHN